MTTIQTENDLNSLIQNQVEEDLHLDYKAADALAKNDNKRKEIAKDISALANSDGGIIIYGIKEFDDKPNRHLPEKIDPVNRKDFSKEWIEQVINSNISPRIQKIKIIPIQISSDIEKVVYVIHVQKSDTAHQANDFRYYKRYNFESIPMHDYEVRDIMNRNKSPKLELSFNIEQYTYEPQPYFPAMDWGSMMRPENKPEKKLVTTNTLYIFCKNIGGVYADYINCHLEIPSELLDSKEYDHIETFSKNNIDYKEIYCDNTIREVYDTTVLLGNSYHKYWPSRYDPLLPGITTKLKSVTLKRNAKLENGIIYWRANADNAERIEGEILVADILRFDHVPKAENEEDTNE